ncbi:MAG: TonB-dependent receptor [Flavobacteriales bacterium]
MKHFVCFCFLVISLGASAQSLKIYLQDSLTKEPIKNATVFILETDQWFSQANQDVLEIPSVALNKVTLKCYAPGYKSRLIETTLNAPINISLSPVHLDVHEITIATGTLSQRNKNPFHVEVRKLGELNVVPALNLGELLGRIPGVFSASLGNGIAKPVVRGMQGMRVVTLLNGLRLEGQQWGGDHGVGLTELGISSVEVIKGPASLLYGADALGGVVYLVDAPYAKYNTRELSFQSSLFTNTLGGRLQLSYKESYKKFRWMTAFTLGNHADFQLPSRKYAQNSRFNDLGAKLSLSYNARKSLLQFRYTLSHSVTGIPGHTHDSLATPETFQVVQQGRKYMLPAQFFRNHLFHFTVHWYGDKSNVQWHMGSTLNQLVEYDEKITKPSLNMLLSNHLTQVKWVFKPRTHLSLTSGFQGMLQTNQNGMDASDTLIPGATTVDAGLYSMFMFEKDAWSLQGGIRYDIRLLRNIDLPGLILFSPLNYHGLNGSLGWVRNWKNVVFRSSISTGFRAPHLTELFSNGYHHGALRYEIGNVQLKAEKASQLDLTFEQNVEHSSIIINPFSNWVSNYIYLQPADSIMDGIPVFQYTQKDQVWFNGIDVSFHYHPHFAHKLHWEISISYLHCRSMGDSSISMIPQPRLQNNLRYEWMLGKNVCLKEIALSSTLLGPQNQVAYLETPSKAYHVLDVSLVTQFSQHKAFTLTLGVRNALNTSYIDHLSRLKNIQMPFPGRNLFVSLKYDFSQPLNK